MPGEGNENAFRAVDPEGFDRLVEVMADAAFVVMQRRDYAMAGMPESLLRADLRSAMYPALVALLSDEKVCDWCKGKLDACIVCNGSGRVPGGLPTVVGWYMEQVGFWSPVVGGPVYVRPYEGTEAVPVYVASPQPEPTVCETCGGQGYIVVDLADGTPYMGHTYVQHDDCPDCNGTGLAPVSVPVPTEEG